MNLWWSGPEWLQRNSANYRLKQFNISMEALPEQGPRTCTYFLHVLKTVLRYLTIRL